ncbi:MAG: cellulase family glycosylhydrolase [Bauldia sp.]|nr:cellulase family glycosylhydrolase [Bauldia sp.]
MIGYARRILLAIAIATSLVTPLLAAPAFHRGVSIHNMMNWADLVPGDPAHYAWPPYAKDWHRIPDGLLDSLGNAGFDFIRLTVDPGPFLQFTGAHRDELDAILVGEVRQFIAHGFAVIVDFHPNHQVPAYTGESILRLPGGSLFNDYVALMRRTAGLLDPMKADVALEFMNEPPIGYDPLTRRIWQQTVELIYAEVRAASPGLALVISGARSGEYDGLVELDPRPFDSNVLFTFHYYRPHTFTHQGFMSPALPVRGYITSLPYPSSNVDAEEVMATVEDNVRADSSLGPGEQQAMLAEAAKTVDAYVAGDYDRSRIATDFDAVTAWAGKYGIAPSRILMGEFGVMRTYGRYHGADPVSRGNWLRDIREEAEAHGFPWAVWQAWGYGGMAIVANDDTTDIDPVTLEALGLPPGATQPPVGQ